MVERRAPGIISASESPRASMQVPHMSTRPCVASRRSIRSQL